MLNDVERMMKRVFVINNAWFGVIGTKCIVRSSDNCNYFDVKEDSSFHTFLRLYIKSIWRLLYTRVSSTSVNSLT
jgi:hypothetical protein